MGIARRHLLIATFVLVIISSISCSQSSTSPPPPSSSSISPVESEGSCDGSTGDGSSCSKETEKRDFLDCPKRAETQKFMCKDDVDSKVQFFLHTKKDPKPHTVEIGDVDKLSKSNFVPGKKLKVLVHGYMASSQGTFVKNIKTAYLNPLNNDVGDPNVLVVEWGAGANFFPYHKSADCVPTIAKKIQNFLEFLVDQKYVTWDQIHLIGHSLGAHAAGMACAAVDNKCARITGLDPARPCFRKGEVTNEHRLDSQDAQFVDVIHTDGSTGSNGGFGLHFPMGHVDFYPNAGLRPQPNCLPREGKRKPGGLLDWCHHSTSHELFAESINKNIGVFWARECQDWDCFKRGQCQDKPEVLMGEYTPTVAGEASSRKNYFLRTGDMAPFALGRTGSSPTP